MEGEIISMVKKLFHGDDETCGIITSGGTESIMSAMLAYREWGKARGIEEPEMYLFSILQFLKVIIELPQSLPMLRSIKLPFIMECW